MTTPISSNRCGLLLIWDWGPNLHKTLDSADEFLPLVDDRIVIADPKHELGFTEAVRKGWELVREQDWGYVFHLEGDFVFEQPVPLERMVRLLDWNPYLVQVALKRQPVNEAETAAGGIVEAYPERGFEEKRKGDLVWTEGRFFTCNPSVYRAELCEAEWPDPPDSESVFQERMFEANPLLKSAYWGPKFGEPMVRHIGQRRGWGY